MSISPRHRVRLTLLLAIGACGLWIAGNRVHAAVAPATGAPVPAVAAKPAPLPGGALPSTQGDTGRDDIRRLDEQIKALREQFHAEIDPLEAQIKAAREKFEPQLKTLEDQRRTLVEQRKSPEMRELDEQEAGELASLADREKLALDKVRQQFSDERKEIQQKYQQRRKELQGGKK
jgi:F0F1-type ATP synthase membrane subunit b/b'